VKESDMRLWRGSVLSSLALALALSGAASSGEDVPRLMFAQLVDAIRANLELTQTIKAFDGKEVEIQGFIIPVGLPDLTFFLLSRVSALGNYCCEAPVGQDETVYVFAAKAPHLVYDPLKVYEVRGVFEAGLKTDPVQGISLYRLRQAQVEEAVGAKIMKTEEAGSPPPHK